jgi:outer membrane protein OmpA-like peptidoglycan-associated protein
MLKQSIWFLISCLFALPAWANLRYYGASIENSDWSITQYSPIICEMTHTIPRLGNVYFTSEARKTPNMTFTMEMMVKPRHVTPVKLVSHAPLWRPGVTDQHLLDLKFQRARNPEISERVAWIMLNELELGMEPTFFFNDWNNPKDKVAIGLSPVDFNINYAEFKNCLVNLLDYSLKDFSFMTLFFSRGSELTPESYNKFEKLKRYLLYDNVIHRVHIDSYTDGYGGLRANKRVARARAKLIKDIFIEFGVSASKIVVKTHAKKRFVGKNSTLSERLKNRRVVLRVVPMSDEF